MNNKILVRLFVPTIEKQYDIWLPQNKQIYYVIKLLTKAVYEYTGGFYKPSKTPRLYDKITGKIYNINDTVREAGIINSTELILL